MVVAVQRKLKWWTQWPQVHGDPVSSCPVLTCQSVGRWPLAEAGAVVASGSKGSTPSCAMCCERADPGQSCGIKEVRFVADWKPTNTFLMSSSYSAE